MRQKALLAPVAACSPEMTSVAVGCIGLCLRVHVQAALYKEGCYLSTSKQIVIYSRLLIVYKGNSMGQWQSAPHPFGEHNPITAITSLFQNSRYRGFCWPIDQIYVGFLVPSGIFNEFWCV